MTVARERVVAAARNWLGTPFHHQGRLKGVGVDCAGVVVGVAKELDLSAFDITGYGHRPNSREMEQLCYSEMSCVVQSQMQPGNVLLLEVDNQPQHLAFVTDIGMLHSYAPLRCVVEHRIDEEWKSRILGVFELPGVE